MLDVTWEITVLNVYTSPWSIIWFEQYGRHVSQRFTTALGHTEYLSGQTYVWIRPPHITFNVQLPLFRKSSDDNTPKAFLGSDFSFVNWENFRNVFLSKDIWWYMALTVMRPSAFSVVVTCVQTQEYRRNLMLGSARKPWWGQAGKREILTQARYVQHARDPSVTHVHLQYVLLPTLLHNFFQWFRHG